MSIITGHIVYDLVGLLIGIITIFLVYCKWSYNYWKKNNVQFFPPRAPWGNFKAPHRRVVPFPEELFEIYNKAKNQGWKHVGMYNVCVPLYMPIDLDLVKNILGKDFHHFVDRGVYFNEEDEPISAHLFAIGGKKWRNLRTKFTPTFTSGKMRAMFQTIADVGYQLEDYLLKKMATHEPIDIKNILGNFSTDVIGSCAFGLECNSFVNPDNPFRRMGKKFFERTKYENLKSTLALLMPDIAKFFHVKNFSVEMTEFYTNVVRDTVNYREKNNIHRNDFLQLLIDIKKQQGDDKQSGDGTSLTLNEMVAQSFVFFIAGFETSATTMTFSLLELSQNQEIQDKTREEILKILKKHDGKMTYDALNEMKYLQQVINEALRMHPPVPSITRVCVEDYKIPDSNVVIKKGMKIFFSISGIHYDKDYYENPEVFDPDRFSEENSVGRHQYAHIPFGEGPRMCIGMRFGIMQTKVGLISILRNFRVKLNAKTKTPIKIEPTSFVPQVKGGVWLDIEKV